MKKMFESLIMQAAEKRYIDPVKNHFKIINSTSLKMIAYFSSANNIALIQIRFRLAKKGKFNN